MTPGVAKPDCPHCGGRGWILSERNGEAVAESCSCRRAALAPALLEAAGIPPRYQGCTLKSFQVTSRTSQSDLHLLGVRTKCNDYVNEFLTTEGHFRDSGLLLIGPPGVGKTHLAAAILTELIRRYKVAGRFVDFNSLIHQIQSTFDPSSPDSKHDVLDPVVEAPVLVLDELGAQKPTAWVTDILYLILNGRYSRRLPTIFTTNFYLEKPGENSKGEEHLLKSRMPPMLVSRLYEMARPLEIQGDDYRVDVMMHKLRA